jgi:hypothetical protein
MLKIRTARSCCRDCVLPLVRRSARNIRSVAPRDEMALKIVGDVDSGMYAQERWADRAGLNRCILCSCRLTA